MVDVMIDLRRQSVELVCCLAPLMVVARNISGRAWSRYCRFHLAAALQSGSGAGNNHQRLLYQFVVTVVGRKFRPELSVRLGQTGKRPVGNGLDFRLGRDDIVQLGHPKGPPVTMLSNCGGIRMRIDSRGSSHKGTFTYTNE
jgi:hypothetical protein